MVGVSGCARAPAPGVNDPYESTNRAWFDRNLALSSMVTGEDDPLDAAAPAEAPRAHPFRRAVSNFGSNLGLPSSILNDLLQIRPDRATENLLRLVVNSTIGLG